VWEVDNTWKLALRVTILATIFVIGFSSWSVRRFPAFVARAGPQPRPTHCDGPLSERLLKAAVAAPEAARDDGTLYGMQRWRKPTGRSYLGLKFPGLLSCAYTVSAIFREACHPIGEVASVKGIDAVLVNWRKIHDARQLSPGDVVFWKPVPGQILGVKCPGRWHVGISLGGDSTIDNDWWSGKPKKGSLERACTTFAYARRPPP
jgi:hypothetical protein